MWSFAELLGPNGISVNAIAPGPVNTPMWAQFAKDSGPDAAANRAKRAAQLPMRRFAEPDEVARAILFLADRTTATSPACPSMWQVELTWEWEPDPGTQQRMMQARSEFTSDLAV